MEKQWFIADSDPSRARELARDLRVSPVTASLLINRGLDSTSRASRFLSPTLNHLTQPEEDEHLRGAAAFLHDAVQDGKPITIFGDYDADGICATALLVRCLRLLDGEVDYYIPERTDEGYGLNEDAVREVAEDGTDVLVTVDCGVTAFEEVSLARELGMDVIVTDHHEPLEERPEATFVLNPKLPGAGLGSDKLAGAGVAFKLAWAVGQQAGDGDSVPQYYRDFLLQALSLVAVGTVADIVPLLGENRVLVSYGLRSLPHCDMCGFDALREACGGIESDVSTFDVGYKLAPRLNASGRIAHAAAGVELLTTEDETRAAELAQELDEQNKRRRNLQQVVAEEAEEAVREEMDAAEKSCLVVGREGWHQGVVGLAASRLAEEFWRPAFVLSLEDGVATGSGRSVPGVHLFQLLNRCEDLLDRYGGHEGAGGVTLPTENVDEFSRRLNEAAEEMLDGEEPVPHLELEAEVELSSLSTDLIREVNSLSPFGEGNPEPLFAASGLELAGNPKLVGSNRKHLSFLVRQNGVTCRAIAFGGAHWLEELDERRGETFSLAFEPRIDNYDPYNAIELRVEDLKWDADRGD